MPSPSSIWLLVDSANYGGIESHILELASGLQQSERCAYKIEVVFLRHYQHHRSHPLIKALQQHKLAYSFVNGGLYTLMQKMWREQPRLIHSHGYKASLLARLGCAIKRAVELAHGDTRKTYSINTYHAGERCHGKLALYDFCDRASAHLSQLNFAVSQKIAARVYGPVETVDNFVQTRGLTINPQKQPTDIEQIAFVGRLSVEKNPEAFVRLAKKIPSAAFHIYGDGPLQPTLNATSLPHLISHGHVDMNKHWQTIDVLIICSHFEGMPLCMLEAMARGIVVIAYNVGDISKVIEHGKNGFIVDSGDETKLADYTQQFLALEPSKKLIIRQQAQQHIQKYYSSDALLPHYISRYIAAGALCDSEELASQTPVLDDSYANNKRKTILFVHYGENWIRGSEVCLINLVRGIQQRGFTPIVWCNAPALVHELHKHGITVHCSFFSLLFSWQAPKYNFSNYRKLISEAKKIINTYSIDVIHVNNGGPNQWMVPAGHATNTPVITQLHAPYQRRDRLSLLINEADTIVGVSNAVMRPFKNQGQNTNAHHVIHNGIDTHIPVANNCEALLKEFKLRKHAFKLISVGSLIHRKGMDILIKTIGVLKLNNIDVQLLIVGEGEQRAALKKLIEDRQLSHCIHLAGERKDVPNLLRSGFDAFISATRDEAFGLVFAEAGNAGLPCIAPNIGGIPEVVQHNKSGLLVSENDPQSLANAVTRLHKNRALAQKMGLQAKHIVQQNFSVDVNTDKFATIYHVEMNKRSSKASPKYSEKPPTRPSKHYILRTLSAAFTILICKLFSPRSQGSLL